LVAPYSPDRKILVIARRPFLPIFQQALSIITSNRLETKSRKEEFKVRGVVYKSR
jgi:hypothetical protein